MIYLETDRLVIRDLKMTDIEPHHKLISNNEVMRFIQDIQSHSYEASLENLEFSVDESLKDKRQCYFFGIFEKATDNHVGSIGFTLVDTEETSKKAELGYFIHKKFWGLGYTSEATVRVIKFAFEVLNLHKLITGCNAENVSSERIMNKVGFKKEAHLRQHVFHEGMWKDRVEYGLLKTEWVGHE